ncbi:MAG: 4-alpha-glucanotransferase [Rhizobiales bacterium]|nr:4-alpha-glucanotransferase [Hyphomicrobiales bacterium]
MNRIHEQAAKWGIETSHHDGLGRRWQVEPTVLARILEAIGAGAGEPPAAPDASAQPPDGVRAFQGSDALPQRSWAIAVQLYGVRSHRNWGHGDFTDLANLIDIASKLGAAGIGLNPLHALFDDRPNETSPYFPSSRLFLNPLYIDVEAIPEFPHDSVAELGSAFEDMRKRELVAYAGVAAAKSKGLRLAFKVLCKSGSDERRRQFDDFQDRRGALLDAFAAFELLRRRFDKPWWEWPPEFQKPDRQVLNELRSTDADQLDYFAFVQWIADQQLAACREKAQSVGLPIGLYLDLAVGVRADGFDAWSNQHFILPSLEIGAPPDQLNTQGQAWGLAGINPVSLIESGCEPFRQVMRASMRYAGAIRIDHILGLKRFYLIPRGFRADQGAYVRFPFEALLAAAAQESIANRCIVIGEDLGTVPPGFQDTLAHWGVWSFQVMLFQRAADGGFVAPDHYRKNALVTFATHDLPTFAGWASGHDLTVKRSLNIDPGESDSDRAAAKDALGRTMAWRGLPTLDFLSVTRFLADTPSRLLMVSLEDALGDINQVNLPGTVEEHPNWRRRLAVPLEELLNASALPAVAAVMDAAGRSSRPGEC